MRALLDRLSNPLHLVIALVSTWLVVSSPWLAMYRWVLGEPGLLELSHVVLGLALVPLVVVYFAACTVSGRWRLYFPWIAGGFGATALDITGIFKGQRPGSEGGGLFATIEGLLLVALFATAITGAAWLLDETVTQLHVFAARGLVALLLLHVVAVSLHLLDLVRD
jgi:hypothetical protein